MNPELRAKLARLGELSDEELTGVRLELIDAQSSIESDSAGSFATVHACSDASLLINAEVARRERAAQAEAVTASGARGGRVARMAARQGRPSRNPEAAGQTPRTALVAAGEARGALPGEELDRRKLAEVLAATLNAAEIPQGKSGSQGRKRHVARATWADQYPEDRIVTGSFEHDQRILDDALGQDALVATGGLCAPVNVDWGINMVATADRPLRDGLPTFLASRGGLQFRPDLDFAATSGGVGIWTEATDLSPAGATKPIYTVSCESVQTVYTEAITTRLSVGNMMSRFDPETLAATVNAISAAAARTAENNLLNLMAAYATQGVTSGTVLGATRDLLTTLTQVVAAFRNLHRLPDSQVLRAVLPRWARDLIRADLIRETAHAQTDAFNSLMITDDQIDDLFAPYNVKPIWVLDGQSTTAPGLSGAVNQYFSAQSTGAVNHFPTEVVWYLYYEGSLQLLDGGTLDLGVVRDSLLDATNDMELFTEVFETLAYRGFSGGLLQLVSSLCASGQSAEPISTVSSCA